MKKSVLVIGGGISGLAAARDLARKGIRVTLLEAGNRWGGRIYTLYPRGLPIELGAEFIHGRSRTLLSLIKTAGLSARPVASENHLWEQGRLKPIGFWKKIDELMERIDVRKPDCSFAAFLRRQKLDPSFRRLAHAFAEGFDAAHAGRISAHAMAVAQRAAGEMNGDWQGRVGEGYGALAQFLEREIRSHGGRLISGAVVGRIQWNTGCVVVQWQQNGRKKTGQADAAVITLPLGIWQAGTVEFDPPLRVKQDAAHELEFGNVVKVGLLFRNRWWPKAGDGFVQAPSEVFPTWWGNPGQPLLTAWAGGSKADALMSRSPSGIEKISLETAGRIFSERPAKLRRELVSLYTYDWVKDPRTRGAYSYIPVNGLELPAALAAPVGDRLFFAGEATVSDAQTGTVFGACESGLRAADEVVRSFKYRRI